MKEVNFTFCTDGNYSSHLVVLLFSIVKNVDRVCHFYVFYSSLESDDQGMMTRVIKASSLNHSIDFIKVDPSNIIGSYHIDGLNSFRGGYDAFTRIFLPELLQVSRCIYMDIDMVVVGDLGGLLDLYDKNDFISGVYDSVAVTFPSPWTHEKYINSGLLVLNLDELRKYDFIKKAVAFLSSNSRLLVNNDQDVISNSVDRDKISLIDSRFNQFLPDKQSVTNAVILHFTGNFKPWNSDTRWRLKKVFWFYYKLLSHYYLRTGRDMPVFLMRVLFAVLSFLRPVLNIKPTLKNSLRKKIEKFKKI